MLFKNILKSFKHKSIRSEEMINFFSRNLDINVDKFFHQWIYHHGYPLIVLEENAIRQISFGEDNELWSIPLKIIYGTDQNHFEKIIFLEEESIILDFFADWIIINPGFLSFCRVWYVGDWFYQAVSKIQQFLNPLEINLFYSDQLTLSKKGFIDQQDIDYLVPFVPKLTN